MSDAALDSAWAAIQEHGDLMRQVARGVGGDEGLAWLALFQTARSWRPGKGRTLRSWLQDWAQLKAWNLYYGGREDSQAAWQRRVLTEAWRPSGGEDCPTLEDVAIAPELDAPEPDEVEALRRELERLPARDQAVLRLRFYECRPLAEIARTIGVGSIGVVKFLTDRAVARLRARMPQ
jgi:DNA-directed RNA polymerase specialized sigma24 family protein